MKKPTVIEVLISENGDTMEVTAHGFKGKGCEALVNAFRFGQVTESGRTAEYYQREDEQQQLKQGQ